MKNFKYEIIPIENLYINPENYRYINDAEDEIDAIVCMFNVTTGTPTKEMLNLSKDIIEDGLNPFEMPIVCFDEDLQKYVVYEGNRRVSCIKLMTQYKNNELIVEKVPSVKEIYKLDCDINEIQCVVYYSVDDAKHFLRKIHQDINGGIGRKQWDSHAKMKAYAAAGNKSKAYAIAEFVKNHPERNESLIEDMDSARWISKLERVIGFAKFKEVYNITFASDNSIIYKDTEKQVLLMLSKLVYDLIHNSATDKFRFKKDFDKYVLSLDDKYKTQVTKEKNTKESSEKGKNSKDMNGPANAPERTPRTAEENSTSQTAHDGADNKSDDKERPATGEPRPITKRTASTREALQLGKKYSDDDYECLNEKGKQMILELEALNIKEYPFATSALCRALLENVLKLWANSNGKIAFSSNTLSTTYNNCIHILRNNSILSDKEHKILKAQINKENYIDLLNTWIHSDTSACVSETNLVSGWKNVRLLIEKYIDTHKG